MPLISARTGRVKVGSGVGLGLGLGEGVMVAVGGRVCVAVGVAEGGTDVAVNTTVGFSVVVG